MKPARQAVAEAPSQSSARVLIVDDSAVARAVLQRICQETPGLSVAAGLSNAAAALDYLRQNEVDVVLLDIDMPGTDGLSALPDLHAAAGSARIVVVSSSCEEGSAAAIQAMALGAADTIAKPRPGQSGASFASDLAQRLARLIPQGTADAPSSLPAVPPLHRFDVIAISASTGGIHAMSQVLRALPRRLDVPILVTQHLPTSFMPYFAAQLALLAGRPCTVAGDGSLVTRDRILVAPGDAHMTVQRTGNAVHVRLTTDRAGSGCMPSADPMLRSVALAYGAASLAVTLSGMGRDGALGAATLADAGGQILVQDPDSSVIWGMPGAVARAGLATAVLTPERIGALIAAAAP